MSQALALQTSVTLESLAADEGLAKHYVSSCLFPDVKSAAQAIVKIHAGRALGFDPYTSMRNMQIIQGQVTPSANAVAALIKRSSRYDYRITEDTDQAVTVVFYQISQGPLMEKEKLGECRYTIQEATKAGLTKNPTWGKYPRNMLFARAITTGARMHCPDVSMGGAPLYATEEFIDQGLEEAEFTADGTCIPKGSASANIPVITVKHSSANGEGNGVRPPGPEAKALGEKEQRRVERLQQLNRLGVLPETFQKIFHQPFEACSDSTFEACVRTLDARKDHETV